MTHATFLLLMNHLLLPRPHREPIPGRQHSWVSELARRPPGQKNWYRLDEPVDGIFRELLSQPSRLKWNYTMKACRARFSGCPTKTEHSRLTEAAFYNAAAPASATAWSCSPGRLFTTQHPQPQPPHGLAHRNRH